MSDEEYFEQLVSSSLDGTLTESEREKLDAHLAECPSCAALKRDLEQMRALFAAEAELPAGLHDSIMQRVRQEERLRVVQPEKPVRRLPVLTMVAAAAVVVLVVLGGGLMPAFSTVSSTNAADTATADAGAGSDGAGQMIRSAAEDAGLAGGGEEAAAAEESGQAENGAVQPRVTAPEESDGSTAARKPLAEKQRMRWPMDRLLTVKARCGRACSPARRRKPGTADRMCTRKLRWQTHCRPLRFRMRCAAATLRTAIWRPAARKCLTSTAICCIRATACRGFRWKTA